MIRVIVESPYQGGSPAATEENLMYLRKCMRDCIQRGESPYASHGLLTQPGVLDDTLPSERKLGIEAGFAWRSVAHKTVVYADRGISRGMEYGIAHAEQMKMPVEFRFFDKDAQAAYHARRSVLPEFEVKG